MSIKSKLVTLNAAGDAATVADATTGDIVTSLLTTNSAITGVYGMVQKLGLIAGGAMIANKRHSESFTNFG